MEEHHCGALMARDVPWKPFPFQGKTSPAENEQWTRKDNSESVLLWDVYFGLAWFIVRKDAEDLVHPVAWIWRSWETELSNSWQLLLDCGWRWVDQEEGKTLCEQINSDPYSGCSSETALTTPAADLEIWNSGQLHKAIQEKGQVEDKSSGERQNRSGRKEPHT